MFGFFVVIEEYSHLWMKLFEDLIMMNEMYDHQPIRGESIKTTRIKSVQLFFD